jgi:hypothetical protein
MRAPAAAVVVRNRVVTRVAVLDDLVRSVGAVVAVMDVGNTAGPHHQGERDGECEQATHVRNLLGGVGGQAVHFRDHTKVDAAR